MAPNSVQSAQRPLVACLREGKALDVPKKQESPQGLGLETFHANAYLRPGAKTSHLVLAPSNFQPARARPYGKFQRAGHLQGVALLEGQALGKADALARSALIQISRTLSSFFFRRHI